MPRKNPLPQQEMDIAKRLSAWRKGARLSRIALAEQLGIDSSLLTRIEHGRRPLRYVDVWKLVTSFKLNPFWLATGRGDPSAGRYYALPSPEHLEVQENALFTEVFKHTLQREILRNKITATMEDFVRLPEKTLKVSKSLEGRLEAENWLNLCAAWWVSRVSDSELNSFLNAVIRFGEKLCKEHSDQAQIVQHRLKELQRLRSVLRPRELLLKDLGKK